MSLLMEALRKAEEAKRKSQEGQAPPESVPDSVVAADTAQVRASPVRSSFSLEPREPQPAPAPQPVAEAESAGPASPQDNISTTAVIETPRDDVQDNLIADPATEDNTPAKAGAGNRVRSSRQSRDQLAAASVFAAKQGTQRDNSRQKRLMALLGGGLVLVMTGGATLWYLQSMPDSGIGINPGIANYDLSSRRLLDEQESIPVDPATAAAVTEPAVSPDTTLAETQPQESAAEPGTATIQPAEEPGATDTAAPADAATLAAAAGTPATPAITALSDTAELAADPIESLVPESPVTESQLAGRPMDSAPRTLEITRSTSRSVVNSTLQSAWNALQAGELQTAALLYAEVLAEQPNDRDALIGVAAIQLRNDQPAEARQTYIKLLTLNPQDPYARTGLLQTSQASSDPAHETELKNLLQRYPELPPLHFALGNFYAGRQRWNEAQTAYFDGLLYANRDSSTPVSPDYAFNLAVSLEQLQQPAAALNYYRQALELSRSSPAGFDISLLQSRLGLLQERTQE